ncbi:MAG: hypothetical protein ACE147_07745 [Candidatus Methylomirabilales bacterium]
MPRLRALAPLLLLLAVSLAAPGAAAPGHDPTIGFYFWRERPPGDEDRAPGLRAGEEHEYIALLEWSERGFAPEKIDVTLDAGWLASAWTDGARLRLQVRVQVQVGRFKVDPASGRTDFRAMEASSRWRPVLVKTITVKGFDRGDRIHLVSDLPLGKLLDEMWERDEWPLALKAEVWPVPRRPGKPGGEPVGGTLRIVGE